MAYVNKVRAVLAEYFNGMHAAGLRDEDVTAMHDLLLTIQGDRRNYDLLIKLMDSRKISLKVQTKSIYDCISHLRKLKGECNEFHTSSI